MPNPKLGTVTTDVEKAVKEQKLVRLNIELKKLVLFTFLLVKNLSEMKLKKTLKQLLVQLLKLSQQVQKVLTLNL